MLILFFSLRLLLSSAEVLVLRGDSYRVPSIVVTYMSRMNIPHKNLKHWEAWEMSDMSRMNIPHENFRLPPPGNWEAWEKGDCIGSEGEQFTKVYLWIGNSIPSDVPGLLEKLEACKNIIELNIDGGTFLKHMDRERDWERHRNKQKDYAEKLVTSLQSAFNKRKMKITWYNNVVYGMNSLFGPYPDTKKYTWIGDGTGVATTEEEEVLEQSNLDFWKNLISETCKENGECTGTLAAYSEFTCEDLFDDHSHSDLRTECITTYNKYWETRHKDNVAWVEVHNILNLVNYLNSQKNRKHAEL